MNETALITLIRQILVRALYFAPFVLGFIYIDKPFNILVVCLLVLKSGLPRDTELFEIQVLSKQSLLMLTRQGNEEDKSNFELMKKTFGFSDEALHQTDIDGSNAKFLIDTAFGLVEAVTVFVMIIWYLFTNL